MSYKKIGLLSSGVLTASPSPGGDVAVYVFDINQPRLPTPHSVLVSVSVFVALSTLHVCNTGFRPGT